MRRTFHLAALVLALILASHAAESTERIISPMPPPDCGSRCDTEGSSRGCIIHRNGSSFKTPCTCTNGAWWCGPQ